MMCKACKKAGVAQSEVRKINVAANCTMMHMLLGVDARSIGKSPYKPVFTQSKTLLASDIGLAAGEGCTLYCLPHVSSYIGADIVAGAYVCEMQKTSQNELFIDIGTNGEIVLAKGGDLYSCSCAAGPALEGMNISGGMRAATGAIEEVQIRADKIELTTIGNEKPEGICGSGILAVVRELVLTGIILKSGVFVRLEKLDDDDWRKKYISLDGTKRELVLCEEPKIVVTQSDVRQVQMAKGAILSGFMALLNEAGIGMEDLDKVYIAGQFGAHLSVDSLIGSGILPACVQDKLVYVGNSSKTGAYMTLMSKKVTSEIEELAEKINYLELSNLENYDRLYSECMKFPSL